MGEGKCLDVKKIKEEKVFINLGTVFSFHKDIIVVFYKVQNT